MGKPERRCPPYEGSEPYLYLCFAEKDSEAVFPLLEHLYQRGVRVWYSVKTTANIEKLNHQQDRMNKASLMVIYLTENARHDERVKNSLLYYQHGKPVIGIDTDDGDNELAFGLTAAARHIDGRAGRNREETEAELIRTDGFSQELIGEPPPDNNLKKKLAAVLLAAALLTAGVAYTGYRLFNWFTDPEKTTVPEPETPAPDITVTLKPTTSATTPKPTQTPEPTPTQVPDTEFFGEQAFTDAVRKATWSGIITKETIEEIEELDLEKLPEDITLLARLPNLKKIRVPQSEAENALAQLEGKYTVLLAPEEAGAE